MKQFAILADATCDLGEAYQKQYDLNIVPGHIILPDKSDIPSPLKWDTVSREEFYSRLKKDPNSYTTAPANTREFAEGMEATVTAVGGKKEFPAVIRKIEQKTVTLFSGKKPEDLPEGTAVEAVFTLPES